MSDTAIVKAGEYKIVRMDAAARAEIIKENMGSLGVTQFDLDRAKIPSGGITQFAVPTLTGEEFTPEISGVIIGHKDVRVFWEKGIEEGGGGAPPDCFSDDTITGVGKPGGCCAKCPYAQFGSAPPKNGKDSRGQACSQRRLLFIARPKSNLPLVISLPPTSLGSARKYFLRLVDQEVPYYGVVTAIGLERDKNQGGVEYAKATFRVSEVLPDEIRARFKSIVEEFRPHLRRVAADETIAAAQGDGVAHAVAASEPDAA